MNIKNFEHIKRLTYEIRSLFHFEMTKLGRSLTQYPEFLNELFKLFRVKTGFKYENVRHSDLWREMQLIRQKEPNYTHWDVLERWLKYEKDPRELISSPIIKHALERTSLTSTQAQNEGCSCLPPCNCCWTESDCRPPWRFKCLPHLLPDKEFAFDCPGCLPPCTCRWSSKKYLMNSSLSCLKSVYPQKYGSVSMRTRYDKNAVLPMRLSLL